MFDFFSFMFLEMDELFEDIDQGSTSSYVPKTSGATSKNTAVSNIAQGLGSTYLPYFLIWFPPLNSFPTLVRKLFKFSLHRRKTNAETTVFPHIVAAATILF